MSIIENTLALILVLSVLVVVHEFGHYAVAKAFGFPVEVFSIGFGKRLFGRKWKGTDYRVSAIPLGGYVKVIGLGPDESTLAEGTSTEAPPVGKRWQRALILLAGPFMNLVLAIVLHATVFSVGVRVPAYELQPPVVKQIDPNGPGAAAGIQAGDRIVSIDGTQTPRWRDAQFLFAMNARQKLDVEADRAGQRIHTQVVPRAATKYDIGEVGLYPGAPREPRIVTVVSNDPADRAGLRKDDIVVSIAGKQIKGAPEDILNKFVSAISAAAPGPFPIEYLRKGKPGTVMISPKHDPDGSWKVGVQVAADLEEVVERFPPGQAMVEAWRKVKSDFRMTLAILGRLFVGRASLRTMSGPLDIAKFSGEAARTGAVPLVALMAAISLQLGIFNLLPIPVLDGGHLFLLTLEGLARRDFSLPVKERILQVGFLMILALISVILYNDLAKNLPAKWWPF
ncbi:MAG TPA: site-2 protease family protein [Thermoanaerobaculia bacterium]|nr:site-2 protease family protein [Thermoanaerobaculia bacterium]